MGMPHTTLPMQKPSVTPLGVQSQSLSHFHCLTHHCKPKSYPQPGSSTPVSLEKPHGAAAQSLGPAVPSTCMGAHAAAALPTPAGVAPAAAAAPLPARPAVKLACCCAWWLLSAPMMRCRCHVAVTGSRLNSQEGQYLVSSLSVNTCTQTDHRVNECQVTAHCRPTGINHKSNWHQLNVL